MSRVIHRNSYEAYHHGRIEEFTRREGQILGALEHLTRATDRQVAGHLGFADMNCVRPRITEMIEEGLLREAGQAKDEVTGRLVRVVEIVPAPVREARQLNIWEDAPCR